MITFKYVKSLVSNSRKIFYIKIERCVNMSNNIS